MDASGIAYTSLTEKDRADWDAAVAEGRVTGEMQEQLANEYQIAAEEGFAQQLLDRVINRVIKSPNKARYFSTFLAAGANQQELINKAEENAERNPDGTLTDKSKKYVTSLRQNLSALRGAPNAELAAEYGVKLDTLKEWNQELRTFLTDKADKIQQAFKVVAVEMRIGGTDVRMMLESLAARSQQAQTDLVTTIQPDNVVIDERDLTGWAEGAEEGTGMKAQNRTSASVQEVFNASETINARFLRLQEQLVEAENEGNQELADEINAELERLTEEGLKQAKKQTSKRPVKETKEKPSAVPKRETKKVPVGERAPSGQEVGQRDTKKQEVAREGKAETSQRQLKDGSTITIESIPSPTAFSNTVRMQFGAPKTLVAKNKAGDVVGQLAFMPGGGPIDVQVREQDRRKGVGSALYNELETRGGKIPDADSGVVISEIGRAHV
jgi:hypothetical protein